MAAATAGSTAAVASSALAKGTATITSTTSIVARYFTENSAKGSKGSGL
jgi:hypothetical protein